MIVLFDAWKRKEGCPMYPVSEAFLQAVQGNTRKYYWTGKITTAGGVEYDVFRINIPITETAVHEYAEENELTERETTIFKMIKANNN